MIILMPYPEVDLLIDHQLCWDDARVTIVGETYFRREYARLYDVPVRRNLSASECRDFYKIAREFADRRQSSPWQLPL